VDKLAELIRKNLSVSADVLNELKASSFQPSSKSLPAIKAYNQGMELFRDGKNLEAVQSLQSAVQADPQFALAYSRLAEADSALGYMAEAESNSRKAQELSDSLPPAEKYLVQAIYARTVKNNKKAIEAYENLAKIMPDNSDVESALGSLYSRVATTIRPERNLRRYCGRIPRTCRRSGRWAWSRSQTAIRKELWIR